MKIIFAHASQSPSIFNHHKVSWIYFGCSYLKMKNWEEKMPIKRTNLQKNIHFQAEKQKRPFLEWIESKRIANKDSIHWWMNRVAGKNNAHSNFFVYLCQLFAIKQFLQENKNNSEILVVCENAFLIGLLSKNYPAKFKFPFFNKYFWLRDTFILFFKGLISKLKLVYILIALYLCARMTRTEKILKPEGDISLIHHCILNNENVFKDGSINCTYFNSLPIWLKKRGIKVFGLPWLFRNRPSLKFYRNLRKTDCFIPEDWLSIRDYFSIFKNSIKSLTALSIKSPYPGAEINDLIFHEKLGEMSEQGEIFWRYIPAIKKWSEKITSITVYDQFYSMIFEHPLRYIIKKLPIKSTTIGFYHTIVSKEFLANQHLESEWESQVKPDFVACTGKIAKDLLLRQGVPKEKILSVAALRQNFFDSNNKLERKSPKQLLILLSMVTESFVETLIKVYSNNSIIINEFNLKVKVRNHPMISREYILKKTKWNSLPKGWEWSKNDLNCDLKESCYCIAMDTGSVYDAILSGCILIPLMKDLDLMENYLDFFSKKYTFVNSVSDEQLPLKLKKIFATKIEEHQNEFTQIRKEIINGIDQADSKSLDAFIPKNNKKVN